MKKRLTIACIVLVVLSLSVPLLLVHFRRHVEKVKFAPCMFALSQLGKACIMYKADHNGKWPPRLQYLYDGGYCLMLEMYLCPHSRQEPGASDLITLWSGYHYVASQYSNSVPGDYPIAYDKTGKHHRVKGINVVCADGSVSWDEGAKRLKTFAAQHSELEIPMPEDLE